MEMTFYQQLKETGSIEDHKRVFFVRSKKNDTKLEKEDDRERGSLTGPEARDFYTSLFEEDTTFPSERPSKQVNTIAKESASKIRRKREPIENNKEWSERDIHSFLKAAGEGSVEDLKRHVDGGIPIDVMDFYGWTALMCAAFEGHLKVVDLLLRSGSQPLLSNLSGNTSIDIARSRGHKEVVRRITMNDEINSRTNEAEVKLKQSIQVNNYCELCQKNYTESVVEHLTRTSHLLNLDNHNIVHFGYTIPEWNIGYRLLKRNGWEEEHGLGKSGDGRKYPMKIVHKIDRSGLGADECDAKITHSRTIDQRATKRKTTNGSGQTKKVMEAERNRLKRIEREFRESFH